MPINSSTPTQAQAAAALGGLRQREAGGVVSRRRLCPAPPQNPRQRPSGVGSAPRSRGGAGCRVPPAVPRWPANPPRDTGGGWRGGVKALEALTYISSRFL